MLINMDEARSHCRVGDFYPPDQLEPYIAAAVDAVQAHLNRRVFVDQAALDAALDALPDMLTEAQAAYAQAVLDADMTNATRRESQLSVASMRLASAEQAAQRTLHGIPLNASLKAAILLTLGHLFQSRASVVVGPTPHELPLGVKELLRPYRRVMMP